MMLTTTTGNTVELIGMDATIKGITFEVRKSASGLVSAYMVKAAGTRIIELAFAQSDLAKAHAHMDVEAAKIAAECKVKFAPEYMAQRIHAGHGDAAANRG